MNNDEYPYKKQKDTTTVVIIHYQICWKAFLVESYVLFVSFLAVCWFLFICVHIKKGCPTTKSMSLLDVWARVYSPT